MTLSQMKDQKADVLKRAQAMLDAGQHNTPAYRALISEAETLASDITDLEFIERSLPAEARKAAPVAVPAIITETSEARRARVNDAARTFFRHGVDHLKPEQRALLTTSDTTGGALISQTFDDVFVEAAKYFGPVFDMIHRKDAATGEPSKFVVADDTARTFSLLSEGATSASGVASQPTLFSNVDDTDTLVSSVVYSVQELDDAFDLESFLTRNAGLAVSRAWETAITLATTNDGTSTALPNGAGGFLASVSAGVTQSSGELAAGPTYAQLNALAGSVDRAYYQNGSFMASPSVETFLRAQVDSTGRALYPIDPNTGYLLIAGRLLVPNTAMANAGTASSPLVLFGDFGKAWNVLNAGVRIKVVSENSAALSFLTREMIIRSRTRPANRMWSWMQTVSQPLVYRLYS